MANINQISPDGGTTVYDIEDPTARSSINSLTPRVGIAEGKITTLQEQMLSVQDDFDGLGTASTKNSTSVVTDSSDLVESGAVYDAIEDTVGWIGGNLFDKSTATTIGYLNANGTVYTQSDWRISDYILVKSGLKITISGVSGNLPSVCLYDSNKAYISGETYSARTTIKKDIPVGVAYVRISVQNNNLETASVKYASVEETIPQVVSDAVGWDVGNLLDNTLSKTEKGLTVTAQPDGSTVINGTYTGSTGWFVVTSNVQVKANKTYWMSLGDYPTDKINAIGFNGYGQQNPINPIADFLTNLRININNGVTFDNLHLYPKIYYPSVDEQKADNSVIGTVEDGTNPTKSYAVGEHMIRGGKFCTVTVAVTTSSTWTLGSNYVEGTIADNLVKQATFSGTTSVGGNIALGNTRKILSAFVTDANKTYIALPYINGYSGENAIHIVQANAQTQVVAEESVSGIYYYID